MWTVAADSAGEVATTWVAVFDVMAPAVDPKLTLLAPDRVLPVIVTDVPPATGPLLGLTPLTVGTLALAMAALMFDVVRPALTCTALAVAWVGRLLYHWLT